MSLWNTIRDAFGKPVPPPAAPTLRNKPGGLAWINREIDCGEGSAALAWLPPVPAGKVQENA